MRNALVLATLVSVLGSGCYLGRAPDAKRASYAINGAAIAVGLLVIAAAGSDDECSPDADVSCGLGQGLAAAGQAAVGFTIAMLGGTGLLVTALVPTKLPEVAEVQLTPAPARVTAPGLRPATVTLR